ncbi:hypothetical protein CTA1_11349 [Colletotrichum tanaceti]|uniref:Cell wall protein n=1 Tax=Colletotrichum tanaceti TaxID=1306861 RepID=A0A4V6DHB0_9PEZI|nr:hypothetical protein CTA1_11349 [Colletotrichum tanaceti]
MNLQGTVSVAKQSLIPFGPSRSRGPPSFLHPVCLSTSPSFGRPCLSLFLPFFFFPHSSSCFHSLWSATIAKMRASFLVLSPLVFSVALAAPSRDVRKRDLLTIQNSLITVSTATSNLDAAIRTLSADPRSAQPLGVALLEVEFALTQARTDILPTQPVSLSEAIALQTAADQLTKSVKIMVMSTMLQRPTLDQLGATPMLLMSFMNQNQLSAVLSQAVVSKVPAEDISNAAFTFGGTGGAVNMGIISLSNPPLAMPASMAPPAPQQPAPQQPAPQQPAPQQPAPQQPAPQQPAPQQQSASQQQPVSQQQPALAAAGSTATGQGQRQGQGQGQGQAASPANVDSSATTADTSTTKLVVDVDEESHGDCDDSCLPIDVNL